MALKIMMLAILPTTIMIDFEIDHDHRDQQDYRDHHERDDCACQDNVTIGVHIYKEGQLQKSNWSFAVLDDVGLTC